MQDLNAYSPLENNLGKCLKESRIPYSTSKAEAWKSIQNRISETPVIPISKKKSNPTLKFVVAASILVAVMAFVALHLSTNVVSAGNNQTVKHLLPDGSLIVLNANSAIVYNSLFWYYQRDVELRKGEAFFQVEKGKPFTVETEMGDVRVLGTSFNVSMANQGFAIACKTGKVQVQAINDLNSIDLLPGKAVKYINGQTTLLEMPVENIDSWTRGEFNFDNVALKDVFQILESQTGYRFEMEGIKEMSYTGQFRKDQDINEILDIICLPLNLKYYVQSTDKLITITNK